MNKPERPETVGDDLSPDPPAEKDSPRVIVLLLVGMGVFFLLGVGMLYLVFRGSGR